MHPGGLGRGSLGAAFRLWKERWDSGSTRGSPSKPSALSGGIAWLIAAMWVPGPGLLLCESLSPAPVLWGSLDLAWVLCCWVIVQIQLEGGVLQEARNNSSEREGGIIPGCPPRDTTLSLTGSGNPS